MKILCMKFLILLIILGTFASCSSLPGRKDNRTLETKNKAAEYLTDGVGQFNAGRYSRALELFDLAYQLNASVDHEEGMVAAQNSIGRTKLFEGENEKAFEILNRALKTAERLNDLPLIMSTKANLSDYYVKVEDLNRARTLLEDQLNTYGSVDSAESALLAHNLSLVLRKMEQYDDALIWLNKSLEYNKKNDFFRPLAADYYMLASIHSLKKNYETAYQYALQALDFDKMIEYPQGIASDLEALSLIAEKMGNSEQSLVYKERYNAVIEALQAINQIETEEEDSNTADES